VNKIVQIVQYEHLVEVRAATPRLTNDCQLMMKRLIKDVPKFSRQVELFGRRISRSHQDIRLIMYDPFHLLDTCSFGDVDLYDKKIKPQAITLYAINTNKSLM